MKKIIKEFYPYLVILVVVILVKTYVVAPVQVNGSSMATTLYNNDIMILNKLAYTFGEVERFDIVVIKHNKTHLIKRVIGLPGETLEVKDNKLYINGEYIEEEFLDSSTITKDFILNEKIPDDHYFVMGDNRIASQDSRTLGFISSDEIEGIATLTIFPFDRLGFKN